jgi:hypothetical protein
MRLRLSARAALAASAILALLSCVGFPSPPAATAPDISGTVDWAAILRFSEDYVIMRHQTVPEITAALGGGYDDFAVIDLPATKNRYMIGTRLSSRRQEIWVRGTANFRNALYDVRYAKRTNEKLGIKLHVGFEKMALAVYQDILPRLHKDFDLVIFGHSLGAAEAVILAMLLDTDGYRVSQVYASGQPRVSDAAGEMKFEHLPILRISNVDDPVPSLPPRDIPSPTDPYMHIGNVVILLDGPYYCMLAEDRSDDALARSFWEALSAEGPAQEVRDHLMPAYIAKEKPKLVSAVQVPYENRSAYMTTKKTK